jgi:hypothetical protein
MTVNLHVTLTVHFGLPDVLDLSPSTGFRLVGPNVCSRKDKAIYDIKTSPNFSLFSFYSSFLSFSFRFPLFISLKYSRPLWIGGDLKVKWAKSFVMVFLIFPHRIKQGGQTVTSLIHVLIPYCFKWVQEWNKFSDFLNSSWRKDRIDSVCC